MLEKLAAAVFSCTLIVYEVHAKQQAALKTEEQLVTYAE